MLDAFLISFFLVGLAEVGDKTQVAVLALSARHTNRSQILLGVFFAFALVDGVAVLFGEVILRIVPILYIKIISGALFLLFGILSFLAKDKEEVGEVRGKKVVFMAFSLIFFSELGDKTQIATMLLTARFGEPLIVFGAVMCALMMLSLIAVFGGKEISKRIPHAVSQRLAGVLFLILGVATWASCLL